MVTRGKQYHRGRRGRRLRPRAGGDRRALAANRASPELKEKGGNGIDCSEEARARLSSCSGVATLQRWLVRAMSAGAEREVFAD
jgi:hypothetical protein